MPLLYPLPPSLLPPSFQSFLSPSSVLVEEFENLLHERFGNANYWHSRYSMVYAAHLREAGNQFMREKLGYTPIEGGRGREPARDGGGDYIAVHLRRYSTLYMIFFHLVTSTSIHLSLVVCRADYLHAHKDVVPSLKGAASQMNTLKKELGLSVVFLASDAPLEGLCVL